MEDSACAVNIRRPRRAQERGGRTGDLPVLELDGGHFWEGLGLHDGEVVGQGGRGLSCDGGLLGGLCELSFLG